MKILVTPDPQLRKVAKPVTQLDKKLEQQILSMLEALNKAKDPEGVGLAAPQVGIDRRLFIVTINGRPEIFINPQITFKSEAMFSDVHKKKKDRWLEGCLSVPRIWGFVDRHYSIKIEYVTPVEGILVPRERKLEDIESAYVQHEYDHLDGILFTDRILEQGGEMLQETANGLVPIEI